MQTRVLLFLPNGLGDLLMALPTLRALLEREPKDSVDVVVANAAQKGILQELFGGRIGCYVRYDGRQASQLRLWWALFCKRYARIYAPLVSRRWYVRLFFAGLFTTVYLPSSRPSRFLDLRFSGLSLVASKMHQVNYLLRFCEIHVDGVGRRERFVELEPGAPAMLLARRVADNQRERRIKLAVGISCGAAERHKIPSPTYFARVVNALAAERPVDVVVFGTSADSRLLDDFKSALTTGLVVETLVDLPVLRVVAELSTCQVGLVGTTGQGHMMAAADLPLVVVAGVTNPHESGPFAERVLIVKHELKCGPCYQEGFGGGCGLLRCMEFLDVAAVVGAIEELLDNPCAGRNWHRVHVATTKTLAEIRSVLNYLSSGK